MGRKVLVACDDTPHTRYMVDLAFSKAIHHVTDEVHLVTVLPPVPTSSTIAYPIMPMASACAVTLSHQAAEAQKKADHEKGEEVLQLVSELIMLDYKVPRSNIHLHIVPAEGGASGVSESVLHLAKLQQVDLIVVGNRGMGAIKRSLMPLIGLGSVSDAVLRGAPCPVLVVRSGPHAAGVPLEAQPPPMGPIPKHVCVAYDESPTAAAALQWAMDNILSAHDHLHVVTVVYTPPAVMLDEPSTVAAMQAQQLREQQEQALVAANKLVAQAVSEAVSHGVTHTKLTSAVLLPQGGASDAGSALCKYATDHSIDVLVVGSRGLGAVQRQLMNFVGLGSVSEYLAHNVHCALAVVRGPGSTPDPARPTDNVPFHVIPEVDEHDA